MQSAATCSIYSLYWDAVLPSPLPMGGINNIDMLVLIGSAILFWLVGWFFKKRTITRVEGALLVVCYIAYTAFLISQQ